ncbi:MFS transporter [Xylocopilactobacillus apis]|uniref:MFS transporter n=1 Tax=Xylocopilactobacillus apis TaxID=2932183 RepID=A0AAU9DNN2_9LACO|nr:MFS transporter [Xylocopilactobacillus apis]BDR57349.1 MFS transporter [Xylocopilactobacillus apis]
MKPKKLLIFTLAFGTFSILNTEVGIVGILPVIAHHFGVSISDAGLLVSLFAIVIAISGPIMPVILSRFETKKILLLTLWIFVLANCLSAIASNFTIAIIARLIPAVFHPVYCSYALTLASSSVAPKDSPKAVSRVMIGVSSGMVLGTPIATIIANHLSYSAAMYFFALVSLLAVILNTIVLPKKTIKRSSGKRISLKSVIKKRSLWLSGAGTIAVETSLALVYSYISDYLSQVAHFNANQLSTALFAFGITSVLGNLIAGFGLGNFPQKFMILFPFVLGTIYVLDPLLSKNWILMLILVLVWGAVYGIGNNIQQYLISSAIPEALNLANGLFISLGNVGTTLGTTIGGILLGKWGVGTLPYGGVGVLVITLFIILLRNQIVTK